MQNVLIFQMMDVIIIDNGLFKLLLCLNEK